MAVPTSGPNHEPVIRSHPPERRRKKSIILCGCCCSCCCCCCLHSAGAAIGASVVNSQIDVPESLRSAANNERTVTGRPIYQIVLLVLTAIIIFGAHAYVAIENQPKVNDWGAILAIELVILLLVFPAIQFAAVILAMLGALFFAKHELRTLYERSLLRIMGGMVAGFAVGIFATLAVVAFFVATSR